MQAKLSAIGLGALIACACHAAFAGPTVTIVQTGLGNTAYADQATGDQAANSSATITQYGDNNHAGDPATLTAGITQRNIAYSVATATISQRGFDNTASIVQDGTRHDVLAAIEQLGQGNSAAITQNTVSYANASLYQEGLNNVAAVEQSQVADLGFKGRQIGLGNRLTFRQYASSYGVPTITQTGNDNTVWVNQEHLLGTGGLTISQVGYTNLAVVTQENGDSPFNSISQTGSSNTAATFQSGRLESSTITQYGNNNLAAATQTLGGNQSLITQTGNNNNGVVIQAGSNGNPNTAFIRQVGNGFAATIVQSGAGNNAGIYQH